MDTAGHRWVVGTLLVATVVSCSEGTRGTTELTLSELRLLEYVETASVGGWEAEGVFAIGTVRGATLLPGTDLFVVVDGSSQAIHYFTRSGAFVRTIGGRGGGPGESQAIRQVRGRPHGGLCTWDVQQVRLTTFDAEVEVVGTERADLTTIEAIRPSFVGFLGDCSVVMRDQQSVMGMRDEPEGLRRDTLRFVLFDRLGSPVAPALAVLGAERWFKNRDGSWGHVVPILGSKHISFVSGERLWLGVSDSMRWTRRNLRTGMGDTLRLQVRQRVALPAEVEAERQRRLAAVTVRKMPGAPMIDGVSASEVFAEGRRAGIRAAPASAVFPAFDRALAGHDGTVWIREFPRPEEENARWIVVGSDDSMIGQIVVPRATEVLSAGGDWLITKTLDELDAPVVHVLRRAGSGSP